PARGAAQAGLLRGLARRCRGRPSALLRRQAAVSALEAHLDKLVRRHAELRDLLASGDAAGFAKLSKEYSELTPIAEAVEALRKAERESADAAALSETADDPELRELAASELQALKARVPELEQQ